MANNGEDRKKSSHWVGAAGVYDFGRRVRHSFPQCHLWKPKTSVLRGGGIPSATGALGEAATKNSRLLCQARWALEGDPQLPRILCSLCESERTMIEKRFAPIGVSCAWLHPICQELTNFSAMIGIFVAEICSSSFRRPGRGRANHRRENLIRRHGPWHSLRPGTRLQDKLAF